MSLSAIQLGLLRSSANFETFMPARTWWWNNRWAQIRRTGSLAQELFATAAHSSGRSEWQGSIIAQKADNNKAILKPSLPAHNTLPSCPQYRCTRTLLL